MDNSIIRSGQDPEVLSFPVCGKTNVLLPELWLSFAREKRGSQKDKAFGVYKASPPFNYRDFQGSL